MTMKYETLSENLNKILKDRVNQTFKTRYFCVCIKYRISFLLYLL